MSIGQKIREARKGRRLTQAAVADALGVSRVSVTQWERDETRPDIGRVPAIAAMLGVSEAWLLGNDAEPAMAPTDIILFTESTIRSAVEMLVSRGLLSGKAPKDAADLVVAACVMKQEGA